MVQVITGEPFAIQVKIAYVQRTYGVFAMNMEEAIEMAKTQIRLECRSLAKDHPEIIKQHEIDLVNKPAELCEAKRWATTSMSAWIKNNAGGDDHVR